MAAEPSSWTGEHRGSRCCNLAMPLVSNIKSAG